MKQQPLSSIGQLLEQTLKNIELNDRYLDSVKKGETLRVPHIGNALLQAYEQLRSTSENIEDHLLLQKAILRFYNRKLFLGERTNLEVGQELVIELTQAQYLKNNSVSLSTIDAIEALIKEYIAIFDGLTKNKGAEARENAKKWVLELLSVKTERLINNQFRLLSFAHFAHTYFSGLIDYDRIVDKTDKIKKDDYPQLLYISIQKALLKTDDANARTSLFEAYFSSKDSDNIKQFEQFNKNYDKLAGSKTSQKLSRLVTKNGAPLRILKSRYFDKDSLYDVADLRNTDKTSNGIFAEIENVYANVQKAVNKGVVKSIVFLFITKVIIGLIIEIPYDLLVTGSIIIVPLAINIVFPPVFLAITALTFKLPGLANKRALTRHIETMIYGNTEGYDLSLKYPRSTEKSYFFNTLFVIVFFVALYFVGRLLYDLEFNIVQGVIFMVFLSTASFLGYRLTLHIKEIEHISTNQGVLSLIRDFIYAPFIFIGKRISYKFSQLNIMAQILDTFVDLPLKAFVRLLRQWTTFLSDKKDELL